MIIPPRWNDAVSMVRWCLVCLQQNVHLLSTGSSVGESGSTGRRLLLSVQHWGYQRRAAGQRRVHRLVQVVQRGPTCAPHQALSAGADIHLELGPPEAPSGPPQLLGFDWPVEEPPGLDTRPTVARSPPPPMAPNPQLTYVDRVVMEIIETERMYVRDLRSIVEVRNIRCETAVGSDSETSLCLIVSAQNVKIWNIIMI